MNDFTQSHPVIAVLDDEADLLEIFKEILSEVTPNVKAFTSPLELVRWLETSPKLDLLITDLVMPNMSGFEVLEHYIHCLSDAPSIVVSGDIRPESSMKALKMGVSDFLAKPFDSGILLKCVNQLLENRKTQLLQPGSEDQKQDLLKKAALLKVQIAKKH